MTARDREAGSALAIRGLSSIVVELLARASQPLLPRGHGQLGLFVRYLRRKSGRGLVVTYHVEDPAVASPEKTRPKGADTWAQRLRSCPVRRLDRLVEHESQRLHGAERAWQDGFTGLRLLGVELLRGYLDPACLFRITIHLAEER